jgi:ribosomal RNA-processing protein 36
MEPVHSDDGSSDDDDGSSVYEYERQELEEERSISNDALLLSNFDDLPTDDSEEDDDSDSSGDDDDTSSDDGSSYDSEDDSESVVKEQRRDGSIHEDDATPLGERVAYEAGAGRKYHHQTSNNNEEEHNNNNDGGSGRSGRAERKNRAIEVASERLKQMRSQKSNNNATTGRRSETKNDKLSDDSDDDDDDVDDEQKLLQQTRHKKKSKHAPTEMSSKRQDYFARGRPDLNSSGIGVSIGANRYRARDPRTESLSGHLDVDAFDKRYDFLDTMQEAEIELLKRRVNAWKTSGKKGQKERRKLGINNSGGNIESSLEHDQEELTRLLQERAERTRANIVRTAKRTVKDKLKANVATGKHGAYYPKRSELRKMETEAKFDELRKRGGESAVDAVIAKRRKKNLAKEAKSMPSHKVK